ncbi:hypothetical protein, partial [Aquiflexum sp.]|uniref:hypothetical protein n=1 Tax=Aquiflexum sp. TaxID=1872584 RepID=UPI0035944BB8
FHNKTREQDVLTKPFKKNQVESIYWITHNIISQDTIDVNIGGWTIGKVNKKTISLGLWCGGTMGYIQEGRFIYYKNTNHWEFISGDKIITEKQSQARKR